MKRYKIQSIGISVLLIFLVSCSTNQINKKDFVTVSETEFMVHGKPYTYVGTNFWYGAYLGREGSEGNRERLLNELDILKENGITNLRVLGASEEAIFENSLSPAIIKADGSYSEELLIGLDYLLAEMGKRDMKAVIFLNNYWEWSGGMSTYNGWYGDGPVIDPADGDWEAFMKYSARFFKNEEAQKAFKKYIKHLIERTNTVTNIPYTEDTAIMSWQLANEPRPGRGASSIPDIPVYINWIDNTAGYIKSLDSNHLVSTGSEGKTGSLDSMQVFIEAHESENIDYLTFHMWAKNWGWIDPQNMKGTFQNALDNAVGYIETHVEVANELNKPIVMEEFGFPRDGEKYSQESSTTFRDKYYEMVFSKVEKYKPLAGTNFWSWGGFGEAQNEDYWWNPGDPFTGDPPQEPQGLNSVFAQDSSTLLIIKTHANNLEQVRVN